MTIRNKKEFGAAVRCARRAAKLTQADVARRASVRQPLISELENGATSATLDTVLKVLAALDLDLSVGPREKTGFDPTEY